MDFLASNLQIPNTLSLFISSSCISHTYSDLRTQGLHCPHWHLVMIFMPTFCIIAHIFFTSPEPPVLLKREKNAYYSTYKTWF